MIGYSKMGMPSAKKRRLDLNDSFDEDPVLANKDGSPNDSFDEDPIEPGPSLVAVKILQSQALQQSQLVNQGLSQVNVNLALPSTSTSTEVTAKRPSQDAYTFRQPEPVRAHSPGPSHFTQSTTSTILTGGQKESGVVLMMKKRNENLTRQLEDARRERVAKEMVHLQEKKNIEDSFQKQLRLIQSEKEQLQRELLSMSFRQENIMNMTMPDANNMGAFGNRSSFVPTKPVDRRHGPAPTNRLAWMNKPSSVSSNVFKHPAIANADDTYVHFSTQVMESTMFATSMVIPKQEKPEQTVAMVSAECQTVGESRNPIVSCSPREAVIEGLLLAATKMSVQDFNSCKLHDLCRDCKYKPLHRKKSSNFSNRNV